MPILMAHWATGKFRSRRWSSLNAAQSEKRELFRQAGLASWEAYRATGMHVTGDEADQWLADLEMGADVEPPECHG